MRRHDNSAYQYENNSQDEDLGQYSAYDFEDTSKNDSGTPQLKHYYQAGEEEDSSEESVLLLSLSFRFNLFSVTIPLLPQNQKK